MHKNILNHIHICAKRIGLTCMNQSALNDGRHSGTGEGMREVGFFGETENNK